MKNPRHEPPPAGCSCGYCVPAQPGRAVPTMEKKMNPMTPPVGIAARDLAEWLHAAKGLRVNRRQLTHAASRNRIPQPFRTASGAHSWRVEDIDAVATYFRNPAPIGRPRKTR